MNIVVTGRIGSGKSTVGRFLAEKGANVIEADELGHRVLKDSLVKKRLIDAFGKEIVKNNTIDRETLGELAFKNKKNTKLLNKITHPLLIRKIKDSIKKNKINVIVAALYYELKLDKIKDLTIIVKCSKNKIIKRLKRKNFVKRQKYIKDAKNYDYEINNNNSLVETKKQAVELWRRIR